MSPDNPSQAFGHLLVDFIGVPTAQLRDRKLVTGLLIAAASAAGFSPVGAPFVHQATDESVNAVLVLEGSCRMCVQTVPEREVLLFELLAPATRDGRKAFDVFARRLKAREIRSEQRERG
jgi:S-adenosylmethionine/arginine decarboxylase-like enzyme